MSSDLVPVRIWDMPGSRHHGVVHSVSTHLVDDVGGGRVTVWWPSRSRGKPWHGMRAMTGEVMLLPKDCMLPTV